MNIPVDRLFNWSLAGLQTFSNLNVAGAPSGAGIPNRSTVFTTVNPSGDTTGATDTGAINTAIGNCPAGQVVALTAGNYYQSGSGYILLNKGITLRGAG